MFLYNGEEDEILSIKSVRDSYKYFQNKIYKNTKTKLTIIVERILDERISEREIKELS